MSRYISQTSRQLRAFVDLPDDAVLFVTSPGVNIPGGDAREAPREATEAQKGFL
jgi:hypothetical protein